MGDLSVIGWDREKPVHEVPIRAFWAGKYEVTFAEWDACEAAGGCKTRPSDSGWGRGNRPVINVSWDDAKAYVQWLSGMTGKAYRLLTEAEWEYVARAGTSTEYSWGNTASHEYANYGNDKCCEGLATGRDQWVNTSPVGSFPANAWGLHDVHGNVWEWTEDCWHDSYRGAPTDGSAWTEAGGGNCARRVLRGGSWNNSPDLQRAAFRFRSSASGASNYQGFRLARTD